MEEIIGSLCLLLARNFLLVQVSVQKDLLQILLNIYSTIGIDQIGLIDGLLKVHIDNVTGREDVTDINIFDERLHALRSLFDLALRHGLCDPAGVACKSCDQTVGKALFAVSLVKGLDDDGLLTGVSSGKDNYNFSSLCNNKRITHAHKSEQYCEIILFTCFEGHRVVPERDSYSFRVHGRAKSVTVILRRSTTLLRYSYDDVSRHIDSIVELIDLLMIAIVANSIFVDVL